ncbi:MAG TPA: hypothetical protein VGE29_01210 [Prosthecobacter sp.]
MNRYLPKVIPLLFAIGFLSAQENQGMSVRWAYESAPAETEERQKIPEWLSIGIPIKAEPATSISGDQTVFRPRSGGATNSRNRVQIPTQGIEIQVDYEIDWTGNNEAGTGVSLSPDRKRLVVNSGPTTHLYEIQNNGAYRELPQQLPHRTYDTGIKGYLRGWSWADDQTLIARAEITDDTGHEIIENRIYVYHMKERVLSRLDLSALKLTETDGMEVMGIGEGLNRLKLSIGNTLMIMDADLKSSPKIEKKEFDGQESPSAYDAAYAAWEQATHQSGSIETSVDAFSKLHTAWENATQSERDHSAYYYAQAAVTTAARAPKEDAYQLLREAAKVVSKFPIVLSRGKSAKKFQAVASVHARVWSASQTDPFAEAPVGYEMAQQGNGFVALQEAAEVDSAIAADAESAVAGNEGLGLLLFLDQSGSIVQSLSVAITKGSGSIRSRLTAILKHEPAGPSGPSRFVRQEPEVFFRNSPNHAG